MMIYEKKFDLRVSDFDKDDVMRPYGVLDLFQTVADKHASLLKIGYNELIGEDLAWVLLRTRYEVVNPITFGEEWVKVKTWPQKEGKVDFDRDYQIDKSNGQVGIIASSKWCIINRNTRKLVFGKGVTYPESEYYPQVNFPDGLKKLQDVDLTTAEKYQGKIGFSSLDHNGHVNNAKYSEFILDAVDLENGKIKAFEINYISEMQVGEYEIYHAKDGNNRLIKGLSNGKECFRAKIELF
jgi:acyl-ACP thioesterase